MARWCSYITFVICGIAIVATVLLFARFAIAEDALQFALFFGAWAAFPFLGLAASADIYSERPVAASVVLVGAVPIALLAVWATYAGLAPLPPGTMQCSGPILQLLAPTIQCFAVAGLFAIAGISQTVYSCHSNRRI